MISPPALPGIGSKERHPCLTRAFNHLLAVSQKASPISLERGCIGMSAGHEKSISRAVGLWRIPGRRLQKMVWTDIPMQLQ
jgi:hypothetical protein